MSDEPRVLPRNFRKLTAEQRLQTLRDTYDLSAEELQMLGYRGNLDLSEIMTESAVGFLALPMGIAVGIPVDDTLYDVPLAVEEPSVIAAATYGARILRGAGGIQTWASEPIMTTQVYLSDCSEGAVERLRAAESQIVAEISPVLAAMQRRGGGYRGMDVELLQDLAVVRVQIDIDVRDAMGANLLNSTAEQAVPLLESLSGGRKVFAILSNAAPKRLAGAEFHAPLSRLRRGKLVGRALAERIVLASKIAECDPMRAVTHNKGIMNGVSSLASATGNDTRGLEAAVHAYAARSGSYGSLTSYRIETGAHGEELLHGRLEAPFVFGVVGGAVGIHPGARAALKVLRGPGAVQLARIAAAVGLAQNFAALAALVSEGIQAGHMRLHATRLAYIVGARGDLIEKVAARLSLGGVYNIETAAR
ncbi:MAG: hydroxymethylglutaryl-CoA reductase, degradative, partial [Spirochaetaceae bacterium]